MREFVLAGAFTLSISTCWAQTTTPPASPAPQAPGLADPARVLSQDGPANLCQELLAFLKAPPPADAPAPAAAAKPATGIQQQAKSPPAADKSTRSTALAGTTQTDTGIKTDAAGDDASNSAQAVTGQDGVATDAPDEEDAGQANSGSVANAPQKESRAAPVPPADVTSTPKESVLSVEEAQQLVDAGDLPRCQEKARAMRVAGVSMPPPLIALAALDLRYHQNAGAGSSPVGAPDPQTDN